MNRDELRTMAQDFLKTYGWFSRLAPASKDAIIFSRPTGMGITDELLVYFHEKGEEAKLDWSLERLAAEHQRIPGGDNGRRFLLSNAPLGLIPESITRNGFTYQVPVYFFDREISSARDRTPLKNLEEEARKFENERVCQPFVSDDRGGDDLLKHLFEQLSSPIQPRLSVILAPAGYGKTVLMSGLYTKLKEQFAAGKRSQRMVPRPLMMLPGHVKRADDLDNLVNNFIGDEYDYGVASAQAFRFWITQGFAIWLLDGVEELILRNPEITYQLLEDYIITPSSRNPQVVISVRKPLLATSPELREALNEWKGLGVVQYELTRWGGPQKQSYFRKNLASYVDISSFVNQVETSATLNGLSGVPYYCSLIMSWRTIGLQNSSRARLNPTPLSTRTCQRGPPNATGP